MSKVYIISYWNHLYSIIPTDKLDYMNEDIVLECSCGNKYIVKRGFFPQNKWDKESNRNLCKNNPITFYGTKEVMESDMQKCECDERFLDMKLLYPIYKASVAPSIRVKTEPDLDISYVEDEEKQKRWYDLPGGMEEYKDIHHGEIPSNNNLIRNS